MIDISYCTKRINGIINLLVNLLKSFGDLCEKLEEYYRENNLAKLKFHAKGSVKEERMGIFSVNWMTY